MSGGQGRSGLLAAYSALLVVLAVSVRLVDRSVDVGRLAHLARLFTGRDALISYLGTGWLLISRVAVVPTLVVGQIATVVSAWGLWVPPPCCSGRTGRW